MTTQSTTQILQKVAEVMAPEFTTIEEDVEKLQNGDCDVREFRKKHNFVPKRTMVLDCRCCGDWGYYEDIQDDADDFEYGTCADCEE